MIPDTCRLESTGLIDKWRVALVAGRLRSMEMAIVIGVLPQVPVKFGLSFVPLPP